MSSLNFIVTEHWSPCQLIREYPHGAKRDDAELFLAAKEYRPRTDLEPGEDAITIIASHGNGFPKECYEALWEELLNADDGFKIRAIWMADYANQGASYSRNAELLGDDPNWNDHSRDLLLMVNYFRDRMKPPFVGLAHSMGCSQIANLALIHPRLFHSLVFIEPVLADYHPPGPNPAMFSSLRREEWSSRTKIEESFGKNPLFQSWDPRALKSLLKYGLRDTEDGGAALTTPKAQEAWSYIRSNFQPLPQDRSSVEARNRERLITPDLEPFSEPNLQIFARGDSLHVVESLPALRPRTLYVYGAFSRYNDEIQREKHRRLTGVGRGGNGGVGDGGVETKVVENTSHLIVFEKPQRVARVASVFLAKEVRRWKKERDFWATVDTGKSVHGMKDLSEQWVEAVKKGAVVPRPKTQDAPKL